MTEMTCPYPNRDEALVSALYEDEADGARADFDAHLAVCLPCRTELAQLRGVRRQLGHWDTPAVGDGPSPLPGSQLPAASRHPGPSESQAWWQEVPAWARAAAAVLCIGAAAGLANIEVRHDQHGWAVRTGWMPPGGGQESPGASLQPPVARQDAPAPWRADLASLERQLRVEFQAAAPAQTAGVPQTSEPSMPSAEVMRRVRALLDESERKQERELALRVGQVIRTVNAQRESDLRKIDGSLGVIQSNTGAEVMRQRQLLSYLVRVSGQK